MNIVGLDEVGRGCWAGPLVAAAVVLDPSQPIAGLNDSKKLSKLQRLRLAGLIQAQAAATGIGWVWPASIDETGLTAAVGAAMHSAMTQVITQLGSWPNHIIIDGNYNFLPDYDDVTTLVAADGSVSEVSAASIIAKVARDTYMAEVAALKYPEYGFDKHVGYGTAVHMHALAAHGVTPIHRMSYKPVQAYLVQSKT